LRRASESSLLRCSFCSKNQDDVAKLISSPSDYPRAYICSECIAVCNSILEDDGREAASAAPGAEPEQEIHPWADHPQLSSLLAAIENWVAQESLGGDAADEIAAVREIAVKMLRNP
jgi:ATP-dependent protease Clp ATPase subunit